MSDAVISGAGSVSGIASQVGSIFGTGQASNNPSDDVIIISNNYKISGWTNIRITRGAERIPAQFDIQLTEYYPGDNSTATLVPGADCRVLIGNDVVITGYIDRYIPSINSDSHTIRVTGRSKCQDLVDCSAIWPGGQISGGSAFDVATKLAAVYGINVATDYTGEDIPIPQHNINYGETAAEVIDRVCKFSQLLYYDTEDGNLFLTQVGSEFAASGFTQGINVQAASTTFSMDQRYADYKIMIQSLATMNDIGNADRLGGATDSAARPNRTKIIVAQTGNQGVDLAERLANWEANRRAGRSFQLDVTVDSWRDSAGKLWRPNTICPVNIPSVKIVANNYIISEVNFIRDENGTTARLTLMPPLAFSVQPNLIVPIPLAELGNKINVPTTKGNPATPGLLPPLVSPALPPDGGVDFLTQLTTPGQQVAPVQLISPDGKPSP